MPITDSERRRHKRVKIQIPVRLDYNDNEALASTRNISLLGTCLDMNRQILPGTRVSLSLDIPKYSEDNNLIGEIRGEGAVVRCEPSEPKENPSGYELGIFFSNILPPGEEKLSNYLDYVVKQEEEQVRKWVQEYREHIKKRKQEIAKKKRALARKKAARLAKRLKKARMAEDKKKRPKKNAA